MVTFQNRIVRESARTIPFVDRWKDEGKSGKKDSLVYNAT